MEKEKRSEKKRKLDKILRFFSWFLIILELISVLLLALPGFLNYKPYVIISESMKPAYNVGDLIYVRYEDPSLLKEGDVICFYMNENSLTTTTHRIVENNKENKYFITRGDNNAASDIVSISYNNVIGKVIYKLPFVGYVMSFLSTMIGKIVYLALFALLVLYLEGSRKTGKNKS